jgi:hypothetical protein
MTLSTRLAAVLTLAAGFAIAAPPQTPNPADLSDAEKEKFLAEGTIEGMVAIDHGVTKPQRATLAYKEMKHDGHIQTISRELPPFIRDGNGYPSHDSWKYNVAAYRIDRMLDMGMVPPAVVRKFHNGDTAFSWWADNVMMEEVERRKKQLQPPNPEAWDQQLETGKVFDELIINIDRNLGNLLVSKNWKLILIDHTRAFTAYPNIRNTENLNRVSKHMVVKMKELNKQDLTAKVGDMLTAAEIDALLQRRDKIIAYFEKLAAEKGESAVYFP